MRSHAERDFISARLPDSTLLPMFIMAISSQKLSTASIWWDENTTVLPRAAYSSSTALSSDAPTGSSPLKGSSSRAISGSSISATASWMRC